MHVVNMTLTVTSEEARAIQDILDMGNSKLKDEDVILDFLEDIADEIYKAVGNKSSLHYTSQAAKELL